MCANSLDDAINTFSELKRLHGLNIELLEQLDVTCNWLLNSYATLPNAEKLNSLLTKSRALLFEIQADKPKILQYNINRRKVTRGDGFNGTDEEVTEPIFLLYIEGRGGTVDRPPSVS
jgi:hypothetical protein